MTLAVQVCESCKDPDPAKRQHATGGGRRLLHELNALASAGALPSQIVVRAYSCLGNCERRCRLSVAGEGRWSWVFGDLDPILDVEPLLEFLRRWRKSPDGFLPKEDRPEGLRTKLLGRVPPS